MPLLSQDAHLVFLLARKGTYSAIRALMIHMLPVVAGNDLLARFDITAASWNARCQLPPTASWVGKHEADDAVPEDVDADDDE